MATELVALSLTKPVEWATLIRQRALARKKEARALSRFFKGFAMSDGGELKLVTLTTPEGYDGDIHAVWRSFVMRMRRRGFFRDYYVVKEWNAKHTCVHLHVAFRCHDWLSYALVRSTWARCVCKRMPALWRQEVLSSADGTERVFVVREGVKSEIWTYHKSVYSRRIGLYLAKYLAKGSLDCPGRRLYWYAYGWVFKGWATWTRRIYRWGVKVTNEELALVRSITDQALVYKYCNRRIIGAVVDYIRMEKRPEWCWNPNEAVLKVNLVGKGVL